MGRVVLVEIHADDDAEESTYFGHGIKKTGKLRQWKDGRRRARRTRRGRLEAVMFNFECWILNDEWGMEEGAAGGGGGRRP
jgi:hypothetical protein